MEIVNNERNRLRPIGFRLIHCHVEDDGSAFARYKVEMQYENAGNCIDDELSVSIKPHNTAVAMSITGCFGVTTDDALDKLADWLEGFATTIRARQRNVNSIPILKK